MADNYLENKFEELQARRAKEQRKRQVAYKKRMEAYRKKLEEEKRNMTANDSLGNNIMKQQTDNIHIRPARKEDAAVIAQSVLMVIPVEALSSIGKGITPNNLTTVMETVAQMEETVYSYQNVLVAEKEAAGDKESDGTVVGAIIAYDGAGLHRLRRPLEDLLEQYVGPAAHEWDDETTAGEFYIDTLAVEPEMRGMNIGSKLIEATCRKASELGHTKVGLLVDLENPSAEKLYTRLGFKFVDFRPFMQHTYKHLQISLPVIR